MAMKKNKTERKQAEDKGVFFWFGDEAAIESDLHRRCATCRKMGTISIIIEGSCNEVADRFVKDAGAKPTGRLIGGIAQIATPGDTNPHFIGKILGLVVISHVNAGNLAVKEAADENPRPISGAGGKSDVRLAASGNAGKYRSDVFGVVGAGKQGRKREDLATAGGVSGVNVLEIPNFPEVSIVKT